MKGFFYGSATALITPFDEKGINYDVYGELIEYQIAGGTDALVLLGTTGEPSTMTFEEEHLLMDYAVKKVNGRCKVIFGCGSNNTADAVMTAKAAERFGADGLLAVTPYYNKCTQNGLVAYYKAICEAVSIPVIAYNVPRSYGRGDPTRYDGEDRGDPQRCRHQRCWRQHEQDNGNIPPCPR